MTEPAMTERMTEPMTDPQIAIPTRAPSPTALDDTVMPFEVAKLDLRGRVVRLGPAVDEILSRHAYPQPVAKLLGEALVLEGRTYPMADVLPVVFSFSSKPQGHGYTVVTVQEPNPFYDVGSEIRGHEFHYSWVSNWRGSDRDLVFKMERGKGFYNSRDGVCYKNVLAMYTHVHALGTGSWAPSLVAAGARFRNSS